MRKLFVILFLTVTSVAFSYSPTVDLTLNRLWEMSRNNEWTAVRDELNQLIDNPTIPNIDKIHYIWRRAHVQAVFHDLGGYSDDISLLKEIAAQDPSCAKELWDFYQLTK